MECKVKICKDWKPFPACHAARGVTPVSSIFATEPDNIHRPGEPVPGQADFAANAANSQTDSRRLPPMPVSSSRPQSLTFPPELADYLPPSDVSFNDLTELNRSLSVTRHMIIRCESFIRQCSAEATAAKLEYEKIRRRHLLSSSGKTVADRTAIAEIECETQEETAKYSEALLEAAKRLSTALRADLSALEALSNNMRAQIKLI